MRPIIATAMTNIASAQDLKSSGGTKSQSSVGGLHLPGAGLPEYPPASFRIRNGVLYVEATQGHDFIFLHEQEDQLRVYVGELYGSIPYTYVDEYIEVGDVSLIVVYGLAGDDWLRPWTTIPIVFYGGLGGDYWETL